MQVRLALAIPSLFAFFCLTSAALAQSPTSTTLTVTAAGNPVTSVAAGTVVTLTAAVTSAGTPVRPAQVDFCDATAAHCTDIHLIGTVQISTAGTAIMKLVPGAGAHIYKAVFRGTHTSAASSSPASATLSVGSSNTPTILAGGAPGNYTLSTLVTGNGLSPPSGIVNFVDTSNAGYILASAPLVPVAGTSLSGVRYSLSQYTATIPHSAPTFPCTEGNAMLVPTPCIPVGIALGDFNGDGNVDVVFGDSALTILLGKGDGTFTAPRPNEPVAGNDAVSMVVADFNQDGKLDIIMTQGPVSGISYTYFLPGNGDGTFTQGPYFTGVGNPHVAVADFNRDGIPDLVLSAGGSNAFGATIYLGKGDGTFTMGASYATGVDGPATIGDFNGDGNADLLFTGPGDVLTLLLGNGDGTFRAAPQIPLVALGIPNSVTPGDFDGDGILDIAVMNAYQVSPLPPVLLRSAPLAYQTIFKGKGDGTFTQISEGPVPVQGGDFEVGDFNGDGIDDLFLAGISALNGADQVMVQFGMGDCTFYTPVPPFLAAFGPPARVADFNNDGLPDVVAPDNLGVGVLLNQPASFSATATVTGVNIVGTGFHLVDATYLGDTFYAGGVSIAIPLTALPVQTKLALTANPAAINEFQPVVLTATVTPNFAQNHNATGLVTFLSGATPVGTASIAGGVATATTTTLPAGTDSVTASYSGDTNFAPSTSSAVAIAVTLVDFTLTPASPSVTLQAQHHTTITLTLTSLNAFTDSIAITCGKLPEFVTCEPTPTPAPLAANGTTSIALYLDTDKVLGFVHNSLPTAPTHPFAPATGLALSFAAGLATLRKRRSRLHLLLLAVLTIPTALALTGCGEIILPPSATLPGSYIIPITATGASTGTIHTVNLTLTVTR